MSLFLSIAVIYSLQVLIPFWQTDDREVFLDHFVLPGDCSCRRVHPMFEEIAQLLSLTIVTVVSLHYFAVTHVTTTSPLPGYDVPVHILSVDELILHLRVSETHQVVQDDAGSCDESYSLRGMFHCRQQDLEPISQYAERILDYASCTRQSIIIYALLSTQAPQTVRLLHVGSKREGVIPWNYRTNIML